MDEAIAALLQHLTYSGTPPNLSTVEEDIVNISEMLGLTASRIGDPQQSAGVEHLVRKLLHIIQGGIPVVSGQSVPATPAKGVNPHSEISDECYSARCQMGSQVQHVSRTPMMAGPLCAEGLMAECVLQTLSRHHAIVFQVTMRKTVMKLIAVF